MSEKSLLTFRQLGDSTPLVSLSACPKDATKQRTFWKGNRHFIKKKKQQINKKNPKQQKIWLREKTLARCNFHVEGSGAQSPGGQKSPIVEWIGTCEECVRSKRVCPTTQLKMPGCSEGASEHDRVRLFSPAFQGTPTANSPRLRGAQKDFLNDKLDCV